ncbi:hypothetical protein ACFYZJ_09380 [Streptomyces sp. NPDC001848]|uniref:hypothetical protein n=1 Tax=Streptomyces sp. NPDC001848 TaxID=3364618 RepID=UPI0036C82A30
MSRLPRPCRARATWPSAPPGATAPPMRPGGDQLTARPAEADEQAVADRAEVRWRHAENSR